MCLFDNECMYTYMCACACVHVYFYLHALLQAQLIKGAQINYYNEASLVGYFAAVRFELTLYARNA